MDFAGKSPRKLRLFGCAIFRQNIVNSRVGDSLTFFLRIASACERRADGGPRPEWSYYTIAQDDPLEVAVEMSKSNSFSHLYFNDIFGVRVNCPVSHDMVQLATMAYHSGDERGYLDMSILGVLADALEEAGCDLTVVSHLRGGFHVKGCNVVDSILGLS